MPLPRNRAPTVHSETSQSTGKRAAKATGLARLAGTRVVLSDLTAGWQHGRRGATTVGPAGADEHGQLLISVAEAPLVPRRLADGGHEPAETAERKGQSWQPAAAANSQSVAGLTVGAAAVVEQAATGSSRRGRCCCSGLFEPAHVARWLRMPTIVVRDRGGACGAAGWPQRGRVPTHDHGHERAERQLTPIRPRRPE